MDDGAGGWWGREYFGDIGKRIAVPWDWSKWFVGLVVVVVLLLRGGSLGGGDDDGAKLPVVGRQVGAMAEDREGGAATLLRDGRVLVTGGWSGDLRTPRDSAATTEIYDPATERWMRAAAMNFPHAYHTATLLADGRVLVFGGNGTTDVNPAVEVYDPATDTWRVASAPVHAYRNHSATLLADGRVLFAGGNGTIVNIWYAPDSGGAQDVAEVYDPVADTWSPAGQLKVARLMHGAARLPDGRVMIMGGREGGGRYEGPSYSKKWIYTALATTEIYDPATNAWTPGPTAPVPDGSKVVTLADGRVLLSGEKTMLLFDPATASWKDLGPVRGEVLGVALPSGMVILPELLDKNFNTGNLVLLNPATGEHRTFGALKEHRGGRFMATTLADGRLLYIGGSFIGDGHGAQVIDPPR